jgi:NadR type nicotinamide-nucleotide adenylyltransferase
METLARLARVCLTGPESTGKSMLAQRLALHYGTAWAPEFAREYVLRVQRALTRDDVEPIARGQIANEERAAEEARGLVILDTDLVSTCVYSRFYYGGVPDWVRGAARERAADLYLLLDIDVPFAHDPARDAPDDRERHLELFLRELTDLDAETIVIRGSWSEREQRAIEAIDALLERNGADPQAAK